MCKLPVGTGCDVPHRETDQEQCRFCQLPLTGASEMGRILRVCENCEYTLRQLVDLVFQELHESEHKFRDTGSSTKE